MLHCKACVLIYRRASICCVWPTQLRIDRLPPTGIDVSHTSSHQFNNPGNFGIVCQEDKELRALINVRNTSENASETVIDSKLEPLIYSHAAVMGITFGVLLPIGAILAYHYFVVVNIVFQVISVIAALVGFAIIVTYVEITHKSHFRFPIHGVVGLALILLLILLLVITALLRLHRRLIEYHHKLGQIVAFFGMANVLLVSEHMMYGSIYLFSVAVSDR